MSWMDEHVQEVRGAVLAQRALCSIPGRNVAKLPPRSGRRPPDRPSFRFAVESCGAFANLHKCVPKSFHMPHQLFHRLPFRTPMHSRRAQRATFCVQLLFCCQCRVLASCFCSWVQCSGWARFACDWAPPPNHLIGIAQKAGPQLSRQVPFAVRPLDRAKFLGTNFALILNGGILSWTACSKA